MERRKVEVDMKDERWKEGHGTKKGFIKENLQI